MRWIRSFVVWDELQSSCIFATLVKRRKKGTEHSLLRGFQRNHSKNEAKQIDLRQGFMDVLKLNMDLVFTNKDCHVLLDFYTFNQKNSIVVISSS